MALQWQHALECTCHRAPNVKGSPKSLAQFGSQLTRSTLSLSRSLLLSHSVLLLSLLFSPFSCFHFSQFCTAPLSIAAVAVATFFRCCCCLFSARNCCRTLLQVTCAAASKEKKLLKWKAKSKSIMLQLRARPATAPAPCPISLQLAAAASSRTNFLRFANFIPATIKKQKL